MDDVPKGAVYEFLGPRGVWVSSMAAKTNKKNGHMCHWFSNGVCSHA